MLCYVATTLALAAGGAPSVPANAASAKTKTQDAVTETIRLQFAKPSDVVQRISEGIGPAYAKTDPLLPQGIQKITPKDRESTVLVSGTSAAVNEMRELLRLLDVKPRRVQVRARLYAVQFAEDGTRSETLLRSSVISTVHNKTARVSVSASTEQSTSLQVTPHINGDNSISVQVELLAKRPSQQKDNDEEMDARAEVNLRVPLGGAWQVSRPLYLNFDVKAPFEIIKASPKLAEVGGKTFLSSLPMYRVEVSASEIRDAGFPGARP